MHIIYITCNIVLNQAPIYKYVIYKYITIFDRYIYQEIHAIESIYIYYIILGYNYRVHLYKYYNNISVYI